MSDSRLAKNIGTFFGNLNFESSKEYLPPSLTKIINSNYYSNDTFFTTAEAIKGLNSGNEKEVYTILKFIVRLMSTKQKCEHVTELLPHIIKNVSSGNLKIRRLVYYILLRFSEQQPDVSLLSINTMQKALSSKNCISRALAIRCLSEIDIPSILPILSLSLKKTVKDSSPLVRSASAVAIRNCFELDKVYSQEERASIGSLLKDTSSLSYQLYSYVDVLLSDSDPHVVGSAILCFRKIFPGCFDLIHPKLLHLITKLGYLDNYSTVALLDMLTDYAKLFFPSTEQVKSEDELPSVLRDLLSHLGILIYSDSEAVVLAVAKCATCLFPFAVGHLNIVPVLLRCAAGSATSSFDEQHMREIALFEIDYLLGKSLITLEPSEISTFVPVTHDSFLVCKQKLKILFSMMSSKNFNFIFTETKFFVNNTDNNILLRCFAIKSITKTIMSDLESKQKSLIVQFLMDELHSSDDDMLVSESITGLKQLIQNDLVSHINVLIKLVGMLLKIDNDNDGARDDLSMTSLAKASIIWLIGEFAINFPDLSESSEATQGDVIKMNSLHDYLPDAFRILVSHFKKSEIIVKLAILGSLAKSVTRNIYASKKDGIEFTLNGNALFKTFNYVLQLTKYDRDVDIRDRSRLVGSLLPNVVYCPAKPANSSRLDIDSLLQDPNVCSWCHEKINVIDFALYAFQNEKPTPAVSLDSQDLDFFEYIRKYQEITPSRLDSSYLEYYNELRCQSFELKDYGFDSNAISSSSLNSGQRLSSSRIFSSGSSGVVSSPNLDNHRNDTPQPSWKSRSNVNKYRLQTLDDFLGDGNGDSSDST